MAALKGDERASFAQQLWAIYLDLGQLERAEQVLADVTPWPARRNIQVRNALAMVASFREDQEALRASLTEHFPTLENAGGLVSAYLQAGLLEQGRQLIEVQRHLSAARPSQFSQDLLMLEGHLALVEGRADEAAHRFNRFLENHGSRPQGQRWRRVKRLLAEALIAMDDHGGAVAVLESASDRAIATMGWPLNGQAEWLQIRERLATLYRRLGRDREAAAVEEELRTLLALADENHPIKRRLTAAITATR